MQLPLHVVSRTPKPVERNIPLGTLFQEHEMSEALPSPVLKNPKLLAQIFDAIEHDVGSSKHHLLWIALTCTTFRDPALNALWRSLDTFLPLMKLLSPFKLVNHVYVRSDLFLQMMLPDHLIGLLRRIPKP
jgi:hypothetical protein